MIKELLREFLFPTSSVMLDHQVSLKNGNISPKYVRHITQVRATYVYVKRRPESLCTLIFTCDARDDTHTYG